MPAPGPDKPLCGAQLPNRPPGKTCGQVAGARTSHLHIGRCWRHGGATTAHVVAARRIEASAACATLGIKVKTTPAQALLDEVLETAGNVAFYRGLVADLPTHPGADEYHPPQSKDEAGYWTRGEPGVYGRTYHGSGVPTGEGKPHVLVQLYNDERKHLVVAVAAALKANVDDRAVKVMEAYGTQVAEVVRATAVELGHDPGSVEVRAALRRALQAVEPIEGVETTALGVA